MRDKNGRFAKGHKTIGGYKKGGVSPMKGKKMPESAKQAISKALKGKPNLKLRGKRHYNWKNGRTKLQAIIRHLVEYKNWRDKVFKRDHYACLICGARNGKGKRVVLNADHYPIAFNELLDKWKIKTVIDALRCPGLWSVSAGRTLCLKCHKTTYIFWRNQYGTKKSGS